MSDKKFIIIEDGEGDWGVVFDKQTGIKVFEGHCLGCENWITNQVTQLVNADGKFEDYEPYWNHIDQVPDEVKYES